MATTSTIATARAALVDALDTGELAGKVRYAWPGPGGASERELCWVDRVQLGSWTAEIANIKPGRKQRDEEYTFEIVIWVAEPQGDSTTAQTTFERAVELCQVPEDLLADDVTLGTSGIHWLMLAERDIDLVPFDTGWACQTVLRVQGSARLT